MLFYALFSLPYDPTTCPRDALRQKLEGSMHLPQRKDIHDSKTPQREHQGNTCAIYVRRGLQNK